MICAWEKHMLWLLLAAVIQAPYLESCILEERLGMLAISSYMKSHSDPQYEQNFEWLVNGENYKHDCCAWERVNCNSTTGRVIELDLSSLMPGQDESEFYIDTPWFFNVTLFRPFKELISLDLSNNSIYGLVETHGSASMSTLKNLQLLILRSNFFQSAHFYLGALTSLKELDLSSCGLNQSNLPFEEFTNLRELRVLGLDNNNFQGPFQESLANLRNLSHLRMLFLSNNKLQGLIHGVCELKNLQSLGLGNNRLNGSLPLCIKNMTSLQGLDLSDNRFSGELPKVFSNLTSLQFLDLSNNFFSGELPNVFPKLTSLAHLDLSSNNFEGQLSLSSFANHSELQYLRLSHNQLEVQTEDSLWRPTFQLSELDLKGCSLNKPHGTVPNFLLEQNRLEIIDLSNNNLSGAFPSFLLDNNSDLEILALENNSFTGTFQLPQSALSSLTYLEISNNSLHSKLPDNIGVMFPQLQVLGMASNNFEGHIPSSIGQLQLLLVLDLSHNNFSGELPRKLLSASKDLSVLLLSDNSLQGDIIPEQMNLVNLKWLKLNNNHFSGTIKDSLQRSSSLSNLDVSNNNILGQFPSWIGNMTSLQTLSLSGNNLEGRIPTEICKLQLSLLDLSDNNFTGPIPSCFNFSSLRYMFLHKNSFTGSVPEALLGSSGPEKVDLQLSGGVFSNSSGLEILDVSDNQLSGEMPQWINKLSSLRALLLAGNNLQGQVPSNICQLDSVSILDLSRNSLSGEIPDCFGTMSFGMTSISYSVITAALTSNVVTGTWDIDIDVELHLKNQYLRYPGSNLVLMSALDLSCNRFIGDIPQGLGNLRSIHALNLSHNSLSGSIPSSFFNLKEIESLDLSNNTLTGTIPQQLVDLNFLEIFNVSYNNLTGRTPVTGQFATFDQSNYLGNPGLCGLAINKSCHPLLDNQLPAQASTTKDNEGIDMVDFLWSFSISSVIAFLATTAILCINPHWRQAWSDFVNWYILWWLPPHLLR